MSHLAYGIVAGLLFGALAVVSMLPLPFPDKRAALTAAFLDRFAIGLVIGVATLGWPAWAMGLFFGVLLMVLGIQFISIGLLAELIVRATSSGRGGVYRVREEINTYETSRPYDPAE